MTMFFAFLSVIFEFLGMRFFNFILAVIACIAIVIMAFYLLKGWSRT